MRKSACCRNECVNLLKYGLHTSQIILVLTNCIDYCLSIVFVEDKCTYKEQNKDQDACEQSVLIVCVFGIKL